jgi:hypothetical protein
MSPTKMFKRTRSQIACSSSPELKYSCIIVGLTQQTAAIALHIAMCDMRTLVIELGAPSDSSSAQREQCELAGVQFQAATQVNIRARAAVVVNGAATDMVIAPTAVVPAATLAAARAHGSASRVLEGEGMCIISTGTTWLRSEMLLMKMLSATALLATRSEQCCPASLILRSESCTSVVSTDSSRSSSSSPSSSSRRKSWFWQAPPVYTF